MISPRPLVKFPDPVLREICAAVEPGSPDALALAAALRAAFSGVAGIGLAAPQIGVAMRMVIVASSPATKKAGGIVALNPRIVSAVPDMTPMFEGCLSLPMVRRNVLRPCEIEVEYETERGRTVREVHGGLDAKCFQHEIDHLDGVLIIDRKQMAPAVDYAANLSASTAATVSQLLRSR